MNKPTAQALLERLIKSNPSLFITGKEAALLVTEGVRLTGQTTAIVTVHHSFYDVVENRCICKSKEKWCEHNIAVRMARALEHPIQPLTEDEKEEQYQARAAANRAYQEERKAQVRHKINKDEARHRRWLESGDGARAYIRKAQASGANISNPDRKLAKKLEQAGETK